MAVTGQVIVINAKVANINGTLEAGGSKPETQSIVIPKSLEPVLREYQSRYRVGTVSAPIYRIRADELETLSPADRLIGASFDARTGQIILDEASSSGAGSVSIKGRIINTDSLAGKIKVRGGSGDLVVTNDTSLPLVTANLQTSRAEKQAVVSITDLNVSDVTEQQIAYVYDGEQVLVYRGAAGIDLPALTAAREHVAGSRAIFQPEPNARWQWQLESTTRRNVNTNLDRTGNWPGVEVSEWTFDTPDDPWRSPGGSGAGQIVFTADANAFVQTLGASVTSSGWFEVNYGDTNWQTGFSSKHTFYYPASIHLTMMMSLKADWPIAVEFGDTSFGVVRVTSVGDVVVGGGMVGSAVAITSSAGDVVTANGGFVNAARLDLSAATGIGSDSSGLAVSVEDVTAATTAGGVFLDGRRGPATRPLGLRDLSAPIGTVMVAGAGDLRWLGGTLRAAAA
ncbi:MAG: hypothetical protein EBX35_14770, partial [Planctomycetia bacterium]|nr:hypothetical protein [Planctomycetia bacterium]